MRGTRRQARTRHEGTTTKLSAEPGPDSSAVTRIAPTASDDSADQTALQSISPVSATTHESPEAWPCHGIHTCLAFAPWRTATGSARIAGVSVLCRPHKCDWSLAHNVLSPKTQIKVTSNFEVCWARPLISMQKRQHTRCSATDCCAHKPLDALPP